MTYDILCPYCFGENRKVTFKDDQVLFRSEVFNKGECDILPEEYDGIEDFIARYRGPDKEQLITKYHDWEFFAETPDSKYETYWEKFNGTTEYDPTADILGIQAYRRRVINPNDPNHQKYLKKQPDGSYFIRDEQGMVAQIQLVTGETCHRRVCPFCHNPLPDNYGKNKVRFATIIGITGAGKTVYLSQLLRKMKTYAVKVGLTAVVNNASVQTFLENNNVLAKKPLPGSTPAARFQQPLFYEMIRGMDGQDSRITETFVLYDVAGEVFKNAALVQRFAPFVEHANGVIMLIDPFQFEVISGASFNGKALDEPSTVLDIIHNIVSHGNANAKCDIPFAVCISKIDTAEVQCVLSDELRRLLLEEVSGVQDGNSFNKAMFNAAQYNPIAKELHSFIQINDLVLAQQMQANYSAYNFFAFTALGCEVQEGTHDNGDKYQYPVGPVLPKRIEEPVLWLFHKLGYITSNIRIYNPAKKAVYCPECGSDDTEELPESERIIFVRHGLIKKKILVTYECKACGYKW